MSLNPFHTVADNAVLARPPGSAPVGAPDNDPQPLGRTARNGHGPNPDGPRIAGLATANAQTRLSQAQVLERLGLSGDAFAEGIFERSGVERRYLDLSDEMLDRTLQGRAQRIEGQLLEHSIRAIDALELDPDRIGTVFSSSLYTLGCPTLAHRLVEHYEMDPATDKYHVSGVGCASGVPLMRLAAQAMREHPDRQALVVAAESMSGVLTRAQAEDSRAKTVGSAIFADGCAAALLSNDPRADGPMIVASQVHQLKDALDAVSLHLTEEECYLHLARELPDLAGAGLPAVTDGFLRRHGLDRSGIDHWIVHPGGRRIIENIESALELRDDDLATSWRALADHGNIGTPSIFYVLKDTIETHEPRPGQRGLLVTVGPGVTVGLMLLQW
jgi:alkylresorcinol/alkylpyrone synthase